ncbi:MAG: hypothetical protein H6773_04355 [Pseudomonadales bacterium]|nr:hypothetical protein [Candidatus Woesebacteria bacterium]MCB9801388.1 hypothetical protein [Pseudomonadales bacterium]
MNLAELRPGQDYALFLEIMRPEDTQPTYSVVFAGVAGYGPDDFVSAGILNYYLDIGAAIGIAINEKDEDDWFDQIGARRSSLFHQSE